MGHLTDHLVVGLSHFAQVGNIHGLGKQLGPHTAKEVPHLLPAGITASSLQEGGRGPAKVQGVPGPDPGQIEAVRRPLHVP